MDIPSSRRDINKIENVGWLLRNLGFQNSGSPNFDKATKLLRKKGGVMRSKLKREVVEQGGTPEYGYTMQVPPVSHSLWDTADWIKWIDSTGGFYTKRYDPVTNYKLEEGK